MTPLEFFEKYIVQRKPCILTDVPDQPDFNVGAWTNKYLKEKAGTMQVAVEQRASPKSSFGCEAPRIPMRFSDLLTHIEFNSPYYYLTSQTEDYAGSDLPAVYASPLTALRSDFRIRPSLMGSLVPYQMNLWFGNSTQGSSSGLHHDFHDNLYVLLRGYKRFNLFAPCDAPYLCTRGKVHRVYSNGLVVYSHNRALKPDGVPDGALVKLSHEIQERVGARLERAQEEMEQRKSSVASSTSMSSSSKSTRREKQQEETKTQASARTSTNTNTNTKAKKTGDEEEEVFNDRIRVATEEELATIIAGLEYLLEEAATNLDEAADAFDEGDGDEDYDEGMFSGYENDVTETEGEDDDKVDLWGKPVSKKQKTKTKNKNNSDNIKLSTKRARAHQDDTDADKGAGGKRHKEGMKVKKEEEASHKSAGETDAVENDDEIFSHFSTIPRQIYLAKSPTESQMMLRTAVALASNSSSSSSSSSSSASSPPSSSSSSSSFSSSSSSSLGSAALSPSASTKSDAIDRSDPVETLRSMLRSEMSKKVSDELAQMFSKDARLRADYTETIGKATKGMYYA